MRPFTAMLVAVATTTVAVAPALATTSASGEQVTETRQVVVRYKNFHVNSARGAEALYKRLRQAATEVCNDGDDVANLAAWAALQRCRQAALEEAVAKVGRPRLTAVYDEHYPDSALAIQGRQTVPERGG